jgi:hypothetical protein
MASSPRRQHFHWSYLNKKFFELRLKAPEIWRYIGIRHNCEDFTMGWWPSLSHNVSHRSLFHVAIATSSVLAYQQVGVAEQGARWPPISLEWNYVAPPLSFRPLSTSRMLTLFQNSSAASGSPKIRCVTIQTLEFTEITARRLYRAFGGRVMVTNISAHEKSTRPWGLVSL